MIGLFLGVGVDGQEKKGGHNGDFLSQITLNVSEAKIKSTFFKTAYAKYIQE